MNIPKTIETAIATILRDNGIGDVTLIRCWHVLDGDYKWNAVVDRAFPCVEVRCTAPRTSEENRVTQNVSVELKICTNGEDDRSHLEICQYEDSVQGTIDLLYAQFANGQGGALLETFKSIVLTDCEVIPAIADIVLGEPTPPYNEDGINVVGLNVMVYFARTDFL